MTTTTETKTIAGILDSADLTSLADALRRVHLGTILTPQRRAISQAAGTTVTLDPPALSLGACYANVTGGAAAAGVRTVVDTTETPSATLATLSDDGATLTFEANVTDVVVDYIPRSEEDITDVFPQTGNG